MKRQSIMELNETVSMNHDEMEGKYLSFWTEGQLFGIPISEVVQIVGMQNITEVPDYPTYARGIINLRGSIIPLIDIRVRFGKSEKVYNDRTCIIVTSIRSRYFGFIVDEVDEVTYISNTKISIPPQIGADFTNRYLTGIARIKDEFTSVEKIVLCIDTTKLIGEDYDSLTQTL